MAAHAPLLPPVPDVEAYRKLRGDPTPWLPAMEEIARRHGLESDGLYAERTGTNIVFRAHDGPWIKLFAPLWLEDYTRERTGLAAVRGVAGVAAPQLLHEGEVESWPYMVLSHLSGVAIGNVWPHLPERERVDVARQVGGLLARLHEVDISSSGPIHGDWDAWTAEARTLCVARQGERELPPGWKGQLQAWVAELPAMIDPSDRAVFLHADVTDDHIFLEKQDGRWRVTGLIDFGDAMVGDRLYEFAAPLVFLCQRRPREQRALLEGYGYDVAALDPLVLDRMAAWCLLHRYGRIEWFLRCTPGPPPATLAELIAALRPTLDVDAS